METDINYALMQFINERPEGNVLRDIAIRTLKDRVKKEGKYVDPPEKKLFERKCAPVYIRPERSVVNSFARKNIKKLRENSGMHIVDFASKFGVKRQMYYRYESGTYAIPLDVVLAVCKAFEITVEKFTTELV